MKDGHKLLTSTLLLLLILAACTWAGCQNKTAANVVAGRVTAGEAGETLQKDYIINDKALAKEIEILDVKARQIGDFLEGQAVIRNRKKENVQFEYRFEWYDQEGFPVDSNLTLWTPDLVNGSETKWIKSTSPKTQAKGFKILIREPNPAQEQ